MESFANKDKIIVSCTEQAFDTMLAFIAKVLKKYILKNKTKNRRSVLLKSLGVIGDYVLLTASFEGYRNLFKDYTLVLLVRKEIRDYAIRNPFVDEIIFVDYLGIRKNPFKIFKLWLSLLKYNFSVVVNLDYSAHYEKRDKRILKWSLAEKRIAHQTLDNRSKRDYRLYNIVVSNDKEWLFEIDRNNKMLCQLGYSSLRNNKSQIFGLDQYELRKDIRWLLPKKDYFVVCPGSGSKNNSKCWQTEKYASIIQKLEILGYSAVLCGTGREKKIVEDIFRRSYISKLIDLTDKTSLMDLALIIKNARMLISNDSSAAHIANAVGTHAFVILGGAEYGRFFPYPDKKYIHPIIKEGMDCFYCNWICKYDYYRCIKEISIESVENEIMKLLHAG